MCLLIIISIQIPSKSVFLPSCSIVIHALWKIFVPCQAVFYDFLCSYFGFLQILCFSNFLVGDFASVHPKAVHIVLNSSLVLQTLGPQSCQTIINSDNNLDMNDCVLSLGSIVCWPIYSPFCQQNMTKSPR